MTRRPELLLRRFNELTSADFRCDLHVHTRQTDGKADIASIIKTALEKDLCQVGITEHVRRSTDWFKEFACSVRTAAQRHPQIQVFLGCEAKALDEHGSLDASTEILAECDIVLGTVHRFPDGKGGYLDFETLAPAQMLRIEFTLAMGLLDSAPIDVLAHPGGMYARRHKQDMPLEMLEALMKRAVQRGIAVEINSSYLVQPDRFLALCAEVNPIVSIGSDVHALEQLGACCNLVKSWRALKS